MEAVSKLPEISNDSSVCNTVSFPRQRINISELNEIKSDNYEVIEFPYQKSKRVKTGGSTYGGANAIRNDEDILNIMKYFFNHKNDKNRKSYGIRNYVLICFGFNTALRAGDLLSIRLSDVLDLKTGNIVDKFFIKEQKTRNCKGKKPRVVDINNVMKDALELYLKVEKIDLTDMEQPLFCSRQVDSRSGKSKSISTQRYNQLLKEVKEYLNLTGKISTHTCRKSFARGMYDNASDDEKQHVLVLLSSILNHSSIETTMIYLDIRDEEKRKLVFERQIGLNIENK